MERSTRISLVSPGISSDADTRLIFATAALDRMRAISAFSFDEFAIVPATGSQRELAHVDLALGC